MAIDPFASVVEVTVPEAPAEAPSRPVAAVSEDGKVVVTLKGGGGYADPWIVIHAASVADALSQVSGDNAAVLAELMTATAKAAKHFAGMGTAPQSSGQRQQSQAPAAAQQPPAGAPACPPGWTFKSGISKSGKAYKGYFPPQGDTSKPVFF